MLIGLDYGTTTSLAISWSDGGPREEGRIMSSVFIDNDGHILANEEDYRILTEKSGVCVKSPKAILGNNKAHASFDKNHKAKVHELVTATLTELLSGLKIDENEPVQITLTVPNAWRDHHYVLMRKCVFEAAEKVFGERFDPSTFSIIPEPVAAALHFLAGKRLDGDEEKNYVVVCDIGGGTTDLAVVKYEKYREAEGYDLNFEVVCPMEGDPQLGGDRFDLALQRALIPTGVPDGVPEYAFWNAIRDLKSNLSTIEHAQAVLMKADGAVHKVLCCSRSDFEREIKDDLERLEKMLTELKRKLKEYDKGCRFNDVYLLPVGGSCRIPAIRNTLLKVFNGHLCEMPNEKEETFDSIASGAAFYSAWMNKETTDFHDIKIVNRVPHRLAIKHGEDALETWVPKNSPDGRYCPKMLYPQKMNPDGETFDIGKITFYQGDGDRVTEGLNEQYQEPLVITQKAYAHKRRLSEIPVELTVVIEYSRIKEITIRIPQGKKNKEDLILP